VVIPAGDADEGADSRAARDRRQRVLRAGADADVPDAAFRHEGHRRKEISRGGNVGDLPSRELELARRALTLPETGEIECKRGDAPLGQTQRVGASHLLFHGEPRSGDDDRCLRCHQLVDVAIDTSDECDTVRRKHHRKFKDRHRVYSFSSWTSSYPQTGSVALPAMAENDKYP